MTAAEAHNSTKIKVRAFLYIRESSLGPGVSKFELVNFG